MKLLMLIILGPKVEADFLMVLAVCKSFFTYPFYHMQSYVVFYKCVEV